MKEEMPPNMPEPRGRPLRHTIFVNVVTRRSQAGIAQFLNGAPIDWYSKKQNTVEGSTFGSEFKALRTAVDRGIANVTSYRCLVFLSMGQLISTAMMKVWSRLPPYQNHGCRRNAIWCVIIKFVRRRWRRFAESQRKMERLTPQI